MAKGKGLVFDNINHVIEGIHCDAEKNELFVDTMCVSANDMMRVCGDCGLVRISNGRIADIDVYVISKDHEALKNAQLAPSGRNTMTIQGKTKEDGIYGSCMIVARENDRMRSLTKAQADAILATTNMFQFNSEGGRSCMCLKGLELI